VQHLNQWLLNFTLFYYKTNTFKSSLLVCTPSSVVVGYQHFGGSCCLHLQGEVTTQKTSALILFTAVKASNIENLKYYLFVTWRNTSACYSRCDATFRF